MNLLLLADPNSVHIIKWATSLATYNIQIKIFGLGKLKVDNYVEIENIDVISFMESTDGAEGSMRKIRYLKALPMLKKIIEEFKPDIVHSHYATSYGLLGSLSNFSPYVLSVWGTDVFDFPKQSFLHKIFFKYNLKKADKILSTSHVMAKEIELYTSKDIEVTPFGIDIEQFKPMKIKSLFDKDDIVIGTIKTLEEKYGIEYLIRGFEIVSKNYSELPLKLLIVGGGSLEKKLKKLVKELNIENKTVFTGQVVFKDIPKYHNMLSIFVSVSLSEAFGVAIIEASSCQKPVIVSDIGGLPEVVKNDETGIVIPSKNSELTAKAIERLLLDKELRTKMGNAGRDRVKHLYNWNDNVNQMMQIYKELIKYD